MTQTVKISKGVSADGTTNLYALENLTYEDCLAVQRAIKDLVDRGKITNNHLVPIYQTKI